MIWPSSRVMCSISWGVSAIRARCATCATCSVVMSDILLRWVGGCPDSIGERGVIGMKAEARENPTQPNADTFDDALTVGGVPYRVGRAWQDRRQAQHHHRHPLPGRRRVWSVKTECCWPLAYKNRKLSRIDYSNTEFFCFGALRASSRPCRDKIGIL